VKTVGNLDELELYLELVEPRACILDPFDPPPPLPGASLLHLRRSNPSLALVVASEFTGREMELYRLGRMNVDGVIRMEEEPSPRDILAVVDRALAARLADRVVQGTALHLPPLLQEAIRWAIEHAETRPQVSGLAEALAVSPRVLLREMKSLGLCPPREILLWGRLIRASDLLERDGETVESVAFQIGYSTGGALGKALRQRVGHSPTDLLRSGGLDLTLRMFQRRVLGSKGNAKPWSGLGS